MSDVVVKKDPLTATLQVLLLGLFGVGGYVGKDAFDALLAQLHKMELAAERDRATIQNNSGSIERLIKSDAKHEANDKDLDRRLTKLEAERAAESRRRR